MNMSSMARVCGVLLLLVGLGFCSVGCSKQPPPPGTCDACGTVNDLSASFCAGCGAPLVEGCPRCSSRIRIGVRFCSVCGGDVVAIRAERARRAEEARLAREEARRAVETRKQQIDAVRAAGGLVVDLGLGVELPLVEVKPGRFMMGSPASEEDRQDDETQHAVTISKPFWLGQTEVTQGQWQAVMGSNAIYIEGDLNLPVTGLSWNDAQEFCRRLSQKTGMAFRLPTEAEWEYACRAGTQAAYSFGDDPSRLGDYAWFGGNNSNSSPHPVGTRKPNAWGLYDMHGNVWEWCSDWYGDYPTGAVTDPQGPVSGAAIEPHLADRRVLRGGGFFAAAGSLRASSRQSDKPESIEYFQAFCGFRVATSVKAEVEYRLSSREAWVRAAITLEIEVANATAIDPPVLPEVDGATIRLLPGEPLSSRTEIVNRPVTKRESRFYAVEIRPTREGEIEIPPIKIRVDGEWFASHASTITAKNPVSSDLLHVQVLADPSQFHLGESMSPVLRILITPYESTEFDFAASESDMWARVDTNASSWGIFKEPLEQMVRQNQRPIGREIEVDEHRYYVYDIRAPLQALRLGVPELGDISILMNYPTGLRKEQDLFGRRYLFLSGTRMLVATPESDGSVTPPLP